MQLLFYEYCTQCYFRPVLFLLCVIFAPCYFPPSSLANGLTPSWIRQDEVWFKEKYRNTRHEKSPIFIIARWQGGQTERNKTGANISPYIYTQIFHTIVKHINKYSKTVRKKQVLVKQNNVYVYRLSKKQCSLWPKLG